MAGCSSRERPPDVTAEIVVQVRYQIERPLAVSFLPVIPITLVVKVVPPPSRVIARPLGLAELPVPLMVLPMERIVLTRALSTALGRLASVQSGGHVYGVNANKEGGKCSCLWSRRSS